MLLMVQVAHEVATVGFAASYLEPGILRWWLHLQCETHSNARVWFW